MFEEWLAEEPDDPIARHMLAACSGRDVPARASDAFVEATFDSFAGSFDAKLAKLLYRAPALVAEMLARSGVEASNDLDVLDAGCGTGLCGPLLAPYARRLVGVDLSERMLAQARARDVYDELVKGELTEYLRGVRRHVRRDRVGGHARLLRAARGGRAAAERALRPGGRVVFTVEEQADAGYSLSVTAATAMRVTTSSARSLTAGLQAEIEAAELRLEAGDPVQGLVVRGTQTARLKPPTDDLPASARSFEGQRLGGTRWERSTCMSS